MYRLVCVCTCTCMCAMIMCVCFTIMCVRDIVCVCVFHSRVCPEGAMCSDENPFTRQCKKEDRNT